MNDVLEINKDPRTIEYIGLGDAGYRKVGEDDVAAITQYMDYGNGAMVPFYAVNKQGFIVEKWNGPIAVHCVRYRIPSPSKEQAREE